jgi:hypothetical protein
VALATLDHVSSLIVEQRVDAQWLLAQIHTLVASVAVLAGDFQRIRSMAEGLERDALEQGNRTVLAQIQSSRAWASLAAGDPTHMQRYAAAARAEWRAARLTPLYGIAVWGECHRLLFLDQTAAAHALMQEEAPRFVRAGLARTQMWTIPLAQMWGNVELASSRAPGDAHFRAAERHAQRLERDPSLWGQACGALLRAGLARRAGQTERAARCYSEARRGYDRLGMAGCAAAAAYRELQVVGDRARPDELSWFTSQAVAEPASWVRMFAP